MADLFEIKKNRKLVTIQTEDGSQTLAVRGLKQTQIMMLIERFPNIEGLKDLEFGNVTSSMEAMVAFVAGFLGHFGSEEAEQHILEEFDEEDQMIPIIEAGSALTNAMLEKSFGKRSASGGPKPSARPRAKTSGRTNAQRQSKG